MMTDQLKKLKEIAMRSPTVVFNEETESGRFYSTFSPSAALVLLAVIEKQMAALEWIADYVEPEFSLHVDAVTDVARTSNVDIDTLLAGLATTANGRN